MKNSNFDNAYRELPNQINRLELIELWRVFAFNHQFQIKGKIQIVDIIRANVECALSRKKRKYPALLFKQTSNGELYSKKDALEWCYSLSIQLSKANKLQEV